MDKGFHWGPNYVTTKQDGLIWAGTTEEDSGFDENPTSYGLNNILESVLDMILQLYLIGRHHIILELLQK